MRLDLHLDLMESDGQRAPINTRTHHLERPSQHTAEDIGEPEFILRPPIIRQLHEIRQRIIFKHQRELIVVACPIGNGRRDIQEDLEPNL